MKKYKITPIKNISGEVAIPSSKSYTNRSLVIASLIPGSVIIKGPLVSDDTNIMVKCLKDLGIEIKQNKNDIEVIGSIADVKDGEYELNASLSGTTIRFLLALCCIVPGKKILTGSESLLKRPIGELAGALKDLGAKIDYLKESGYPPLVVNSSKLTKNETILHGDISSQFFSAILMIGPSIGGVEIDVLGEQISKPYIDMTISLMKYFGVKVENQGYKKYQVSKLEKYQARDYKVEGDYSSAGYFMAMASLTKSKLILNNLTEDSLQADKNFVKILEKMGTKFRFENDSLLVEGSGVKPLDVNMEDCPDQAQTLAVLLSFANGKSTISGIRSLRLKETERILALQNELSKMGIKTESTFDSLTIYGGNPKAAEINTYNDHRMAMSFSIAGLSLEGLIINNPEVVTKTFPNYWKILKSLGVNIDEV